MTIASQEINKFKNEIFQINNSIQFNEVSLRIFHFQSKYNEVYKEYLNNLGLNPSKIKNLREIPFMPIELFKNRNVIIGSGNEEMIFESSGTTGVRTSKHMIKDLEIYKWSYLQGFQHFFGSVNNYCFFGLLPSYLERKGSSLVFMVDGLINKSGCGGFFLNNFELLEEKILENEEKGVKSVLIGVSFALLDFIKSRYFNLKNTLIIETGGMKGRQKELVREELHQLLMEGFGVDKIYSEYGMTELLSQAYSLGKGLFNCPPWMNVVIKELTDPFSEENEGRTGAINVIDLANLCSCSFIETKDLGRKMGDSFEVLGRIDNSDIRGCSLMI